MFRRNVSVPSGLLLTASATTANANRTGSAPLDRGAEPPSVAGRLAPAPIHLDIEIPDLLPQRVAVEAEQIGSTDLVTAGGGERGREQRHLDLLQDAMIEARRRHAVREALEVRGEISFHRAAEIVDAMLDGGTRADRGWRQLAVDDGARDHVLGIERSKTTGEVLELAHVARPAVLLHPLQRQRVE